MSYDYKSLQQLRNESKAHSSRALLLIEEAKEIFLQMKRASINSPDYFELQKQWLEKDKQARAEMEKSIKLNERFIQELNRFKNRNIN